MKTMRLPEGQVDLLGTLARHLQANGARGWLVGGSVRDLARGRPGGDLDIATDGDAPELARFFADATGGAWVLLDAPTGSARIVWTVGKGRPGWPDAIDVVRLRAPTIEDDLRARDFTINALALPLERVDAPAPSDVIDPVGGLPDLRAGTLRACGPRSLLDDPLRLLRAVRLAASFDLQIADELETELRARHALIQQVSAERVRDELLKLLGLPDAGRWLKYMDHVGLLTAIVPELEPARACEQPIVHFWPVLDHVLEAVVAADWLLHSDAPSPPAAACAYPELTARLPYRERIDARMAEIVDGVPRLALVKFAVLLHDVAKPETRAVKPDGGVSFYDHQIIGAETAWAIARRLRLSRAGCDYVRLIVREHMRPGQLNELGTELTTRAIYRFFRATGDAAPEVLIHSLCDHLAMKGPRLVLDGWARHLGWTARMLELFYEDETTLRPEPLLRGNDLIRELKLRPGPLIGRLLEEVREAQATGEVTTREAALALARRLAQDSEAVITRQEHT